MSKFKSEDGTGANEVYYFAGNRAPCYLSYIPAGVSKNSHNPDQLPETVLVTNDHLMMMFGADVRCIFADVREEFSQCSTEEECLAMFEKLKEQHTWTEDFNIGHR